MAADRRRGALAHRDAHAVRLLRRPDAFDLERADHDAVGALALLAHFDETRDLHVAGGRLQDRMRHVSALERRGGEAGGGRGERQRHRERDRPGARQNGRAGADRGERHRGPPGGLAFGGEIDRDAQPERDRQPGQQPAWNGLGDGVAAQTRGERRRRCRANIQATAAPADARRAARFRSGPCPTTAPCAAPPRRALTMRGRFICLWPRRRPLWHKCRAGRQSD